MNFAEKMIAGLIERVCKNYLTSIIGGLVVLSATLGGAAQAIATTLVVHGVNVHSWLVTAAAIAIGVACCLAKDTGAKLPTEAGGASPTAKILVFAMIGVLLASMQTACSGVTVAQDIVNWTPALQSAVSVIDSTASVLAPQDAAVFTAATVGFDAASNLLVAQAKTYLTNPSASVLAELQAQVVSFQQSVNAALLAAVKIVNPASEQKAMTDINAVATVVNAILALVLSISSKAAAGRMAAAAQIKIARVETPARLNESIGIVARHYGLSDLQAQVTVNQVGYELAYNGF